MSTFVGFSWIEDSALIMFRKSVWNHRYFSFNTRKGVGKREREKRSNRICDVKADRKKCQMLLFLFLLLLFSVNHGHRLRWNINMIGSISFLSTPWSSRNKEREEQKRLFIDHFVATYFVWFFPCYLSCQDQIYTSRVCKTLKLHSTCVCIYS